MVIQENKINKIHTWLQSQNVKWPEYLHRSRNGLGGIIKGIYLFQLVPMRDSSPSLPSLPSLLIHLQSERGMKSKSYSDLVSVVLIVTDCQLKESQ